jgi:hypothetical protein
LTLPDRFESKGKAGSDGLKITSDKDSRKATVKTGWVEGLNRCGEVITGIVVIDLQEALASTGHDLSVGLGDQLGVPSVVENSGESAIASEVTLHENLTRRNFSN